MDYPAARLIRWNTLRLEWNPDGYVLSFEHGVQDRAHHLYKNELEDVLGVALLSSPAVLHKSSTLTNFEPGETRLLIERSFIDQDPDAFFATVEDIATRSTIESESLNTQDNAAFERWVVQAGNR